MTASLSGCNDFLDVTPSDQYSDASVFTSTEGAQQVLIGAYDWFTKAITLIIPINIFSLCLM